MKIKCLLWDFGNTLCDEQFIWSSGPQWEAAYRLRDEDLAEAWNTGRIGDLEFASSLTRYIDMSPLNILAHMRDRCNHVEFYDRTKNAIPTTLPANTAKLIRLSQVTIGPFG